MSREAIKKIKEIGDYIAQSNAWDIRDELYKCCDNIEKDLEVLEAIKRNLCLVDSCIDFYTDEEKNINTKFDTNDYQIVLAYLIDATCPFCLSKNVKVKYAKALENRRLYYCYCDDCHKDFGSVRGIKNVK